MKRVPIGNTSNTRSTWLPNLFAQPAEQPPGSLVQRWYALTAPSQSADETSFIKREAIRKARLLSTVAFFFLSTMLFFLPGTLFTPLPALYLDLTIIGATLIALFVNQRGNTLLAGVIMVATFEVALAGTTVLLPTLDITKLQLYDLLIIGELLAASLLSVRSIFLCAVLNSLFICIDLLSHAKVAELVMGMNMQLLPIVGRPVGLQFIVAGVAFLWVHSASKAIERANRAEVVASLEHMLATQQATVEEEKRELEESIQQLVQAHVDASNLKVTGRIPYPTAKVLWPLVGVINSLWIRLQHAQQTEQELQQLKQAITLTAQNIQQALSTSQSELPLTRTSTDLDALILSLRPLSARRNIKRSQ